MPVLPDYVKWREMIFKVTAAQGGLTNDAPGQVYGVVMDVGLVGPGRAGEAFVISESAFATGEASLKTAFGGGVFGLGGDAKVAEHAKQIVRAAGALSGAAKPVNDFPLPTVAQVYFYFLTTSGVRVYQCQINDLRSGHPYAELFGRFSEIKKKADSIMDSQNKK
jgi:hypothetical protein